MIFKFIPLITTIAVFSYAAAPDAGSLIQDVQKQFDKRKLPTSVSSGVQQQSSEVKTPEQTGPKVLVSAFVLSGNTIVSNEELQSVVSGYYGQKLTFSQIQNVTRVIADYYRSKGYSARAFLPPQEVKNGKIEVMILEGKLSDIEVYTEKHEKKEAQDINKSTRLDPKIAKAIIESAHPIGELLQTKKLQRGLLILGDTPGVISTAKLIAGKKAGDSKASVQLEDAAFMNAFLVYTNSGSKSTGSDQISLSSNINSPLSLGDQITLQAMATQGIRYVNGGYSIPIGYSGLKAGISASKMTYEVTDGPEADGDATTVGIWTSYPIIRSSKNNLNITLRYDQKYYENRSVNVTTSDKTNKGFSASLAGSYSDSYGQTSYGVTINRGKMDLTGLTSDYVSDQATAQTNGSYTKVLLNASRNQRISDTFSLVLSGILQKSDKNLDSGEKLYLGGANGVRAYPTNEAGGDEGWLINTEITKSLKYGFSAGLFYDIGQIKQHHTLYTNWQGASTADNKYILKGAGINVNYYYNTWSAKATIAFKDGDNPNPQPDGTDNDSTDKNPRVWVQLMKVF